MIHLKDSLKGKIRLALSDILFQSVCLLLATRPSDTLTRPRLQVRTGDKLNTVTARRPLAICPGDLAHFVNPFAAADDICHQSYADSVTPD